jgi:flagellar M-ring protein FliF
MEKLSGLFRALGPVRLATIAGVTVALAAVFTWLIVASGKPDLALLYGDLDPTDAGRVVQQLDAAKVPHRLAPDGSAVFVPKDQVARLRVTLAEQGLPAGGSIGYEIFDRTDALGSTNFLQNVNLVRALEGELARTMRSVAQVKAARVHLVVPRRDLFSRERQEPSASVLLQMRGTSRLSPAQVSAVQHLIASAVPGLATARISIVDGQGTLLSGTNADDAEGGLDGPADARRRGLESRLARTIDQLLERTVGAGKVRAEVSADMDFDRINSSEEIFNPDGQVVRSTQTVDERSASADREADTPVGVAPNLPDPNAQAAGAASSNSSEQRNEETINYEISKKVINHVREAGTIRRLSVAVLVDGTYVTAADGSRTYQPRPAEELEQLASLVRNAVGFSKERGDTVEVVNMRFADLDLPDDAAEAPLFGLDRSDLLRLAQFLVLFIFAVLVLVLVVRPLVVRSVAALPAASAAAPAQIAAGEALPALAAPGTTLPAVAGGERRPEAAESLDDMISVHNIEGQLKASTLKRFGDIVDKHPEESLAIVRSWLHTEE